MAKTNFENLRVYKLAEQLADQIWQIVVKWDYFATACKWLQLLMVSGPIFQKEPAEAVFKTIVGLLISLAVRCMKPNTGYDGLTDASF